LLRGVFVTGTDTGVGKTVVCATFMHRYRRLQTVCDTGSAMLRYWKPVQTGIERDDDTREVHRLGGCGPRELLKDGIRLQRPLSPNVAARLSGVTIDTQTLLAMLEVQPPANRWIVEGAGGVLVPLNESHLMIDFMVRLALPVVVVARTRLGTINHTLLTLEALAARALAVPGVVMVGGRNPETRRAIEAFGRVPVIGELPRFDPLTSRALARWAGSELDTDGRLLEWLR
jgi:malonyl-CoA O-methyltransferase